MVLWGQVTSTHSVCMCKLLGTPVLWCPWKPGRQRFHGTVPPSESQQGSVLGNGCYDYNASENPLFQEWLCST